MIELNTILANRHSREGGNLNAESKKIVFYGNMYNLDSRLKHAGMTKALEISRFFEIPIQRVRKYLTVLIRQKKNIRSKR